jgi:hypothetical protein
MEGDKLQWLLYITKAFLLYVCVVIVVILPFRSFDIKILIEVY